MSSSTIASSLSNVPFNTSLKVNPTLHWNKFQKELITFAASLVPDIIPSGVVFAVVSLAVFNGFPGIMVANAAGVMVATPPYDLAAEIPALAPNATNAQVKIHDTLRTNKALVLQAVALVKSRMIVSMPDQDKSHLDNPVYGLANYNPFQLYTHLHGRYGTLEQADFTIIFDRLKASKLPGQDYAELAEVHRDLHSLLLSAGQPSTELAKTTYYQEALRDDFQGRAAVDVYIRLHPQMAARNFADMVATVILQAPTIPVTNVSLGYSSAMMSTASAVSTSAPTDAVGLAQHIAQCQKDLAALSRKQRGPSPAPPAGGSTLKYCHKHGYQKSHAGTDCVVMKAQPTKYMAQHLSAKDHLTPPGGNPTNRG